ncbi:hypothetical protein GUJ93_ZPchr0012g21786 [Zizania palustris]|uniref:Uncharacterized protein n=1 Tax=Zizania palustris TaxID=103762 RepID=A0A8J5WJ70_ZIZPA|nr:hypothetical protein GUJ93_ZPchr0012g21786 [Zizania palustris]
MISAEEQQIRDELEADIEEDLEREIIDDMCRLAHHLQRLYQHKDWRKLTRPATNYRMPLGHTATPVLSEINIRIKLNGQCKIDITKIEQDAAAEQRSMTMKTRQADTVCYRKQQNHPVVPWR